MHSIKRLLSTVVLLALLCSTLFSLPSCGRRPKEFTVQWFDFFDTVTVITGYAASKEEFDAVAARIREELAVYHRLYDIYHTYDGIQNLATVNALTDGVHSEVTVDERILDLLQFACVLEQQTGGELNVAMGALLSVWHGYRTDGRDNPDAARLPSENELCHAAEHADPYDVCINAEGKTVFLADPEMTLDVGAVAKGYAVECIAQQLEVEGITGYLINVGGNVRALGSKPDGSAWSVAVESPEGSSYAATLALAGQALVTSGSYQRYYTVDGVRYHHIIDPDTRMPATAFASVSILSKSSALADALSTALFCMSYEEGLTLVNSYGNVGAMWILPDGEIRMNDVFRAQCMEA